MFARLVAVFAFVFIASIAQAQTIIWSAAGTTCVPNGAAAGHYQTGVTVAAVRHLGNETGTLVFTCGIDRFESAISDWVLKLSYRDSTGTATTGSVVAKLFRMPIGGYTPVALGTVNSNSIATTTNNTLNSAASFGHTFNFNNNVYFVQVALTRSAASAIVQFHSVAIEEK